MITRKWLPVLVLLGLADAGSRPAACEPAGGLQFVCGPKNAEDLVLVPGTHWILSSGLADGASFFLIDSRSGAWRPLTFEVKPDVAFTNCPSPPVLTNFNTHGLSIRDIAPWHLPAACRGTRCARGDRGV